MKILFWFISIGIMCASFAISAESIIEVNALNYPVWIERDQQKIPIGPGYQLNQDDVIKTGQYGRAWLSLEDGSVVKLGQNAQFKITTAQYVGQNDGSILKAAFNVLKGAFRFTTSFFDARRKIPHQISIKIGAITAGIRGTDIWGRANDAEDFVTLLEGLIEVNAEGEQTIMLSEPLSLYKKKRDQKADEVTVVDLTTVKKLGAETELSTDEGIATTSGIYDLVLMSLNDPSNLLQILDKFYQGGYAVDTMVIEVEGEKFTRVLIKGLVSKQAAENLSRRMIDEFSLQSVWVRKHSF